MDLLQSCRDSKLQLSSPRNWRHHLLLLIVLELVSCNTTLRATHLGERFSAWRPKKRVLLRLLKSII
jgi:hypothetical protein